jgi:hypothetical protein
VFIHNSLVPFHQWLILDVVCHGLFCCPCCFGTGLNSAANSSFSLRLRGFLAFDDFVRCLGALAC